jgi:hypothetical protein
MAVKVNFYGRSLYEPFGCVYFFWSGKAINGYDCYVRFRWKKIQFVIKRVGAFLLP